MDLVAVGTVGDVVSLTDENRTIVKYGLNKINAGGRKALKHLTKSISLQWITSENISFGIAPHINENGVIVCETGSEEFLPENIEGFTSKRYKYGKIALTVYRKGE